MPKYQPSRHKLLQQSVPVPYSTGYHKTYEQDLYSAQVFHLSEEHVRVLWNHKKIHIYIYITILIALFVTSKYIYYI